VVEVVVLVEVRACFDRSRWSVSQTQRHFLLHASRAGGPRASYPSNMTAFCPSAKGTPNNNNNKKENISVKIRSRSGTSRRKKRTAPAQKPLAEMKNACFRLEPFRLVVGSRGVTRSLRFNTQTLTGETLAALTQLGP